MLSSYLIKSAISMNTYFRPVVQWPAVTTEFSLTKVPPHICANFAPTWWIWRLTDHGHAPTSASCPPTIRDPEVLSMSGRSPHSTKQNRVSYKAHTEKQSFWWASHGWFFVSTVLLAVIFLMFPARALILERKCGYFLRPCERYFIWLQAYFLHLCLCTSM